MPTTCSALRCTNRQRKGSGITFHSFPHDPVRRQKWISAVGRINWIPSIHASLCSVHFEEKCFDRTGQTVRLKDGSVPTVFLSPLNYSPWKGAFTYQQATTCFSVSGQSSNPKTL